MLKNVLMCAKHDRFWTSVSDRLMDLTKAKIKVWIGTGSDSIQENRQYISYEPFDLFHLKGMTLNGGTTQIDLKNIETLDYYNFGKILDRADVNSMLSFAERNHLLFAHLCFWHDLLIKNAIEIIIFSNTPHTPDSYGLFISAKMLKIKMISINVTPFPGLVYLTEPHTERILIGTSRKDEANETYNTIDEFNSSFFLRPDAELWYMKTQREQEKTGFRWQRIKNALKKNLTRPRKRQKPYKLTTSEKKYRSIKRHDGFYDGSSKSALSELLVKAKWSYFRHRLERELRSCEVSGIPEKFLYFPLHYQPEATTAPGAGFFSDQHVLVDLISKYLPEDVFLVLKEHPTQLYRNSWGISGRSIGYWKKISRNNKVILVSRNESSKELIEKSIGVITATGTAGYEAILQGKTALVFGKPWYLQHPRAIETNFVNVGKAIEKIIQQRSVQARDLADSENEEFMRIASAFLIKCDVHGYTKGQVERNPAHLATVISQYVN